MRHRLISVLSPALAARAAAMPSLRFPKSRKMRR
jgi:hypothetical protein